MALAAERFCLGFKRNPGAGTLMVIWGPNGTGKTHTATAVHLWVSFTRYGMQYVPRPNDVRTPNSVFWHWPQVVDDMKAGNWSGTAYAKEPELLVLDEIGGDHDPSKFGCDKLCRILSERAKKWTIVTTNKTPSEWPEAFDRRVESRLLRNSTIISLDQVPDYATA